MSLNYVNKSDRSELHPTCSTWPKF